MISKSQVSFIKSLHHKKFRREHGLFIVEGLKSLQEFVRSEFIIESIYITPGAHPKLGKLSQNIKVYEISIEQLAQISLLKTPQELLALVRIPRDRKLTSKDLKGSFTLALDGIQDPGNLGTIIRTADWFGIDKIICSEDTVEAYNPKVVHSTMGSLARVAVYYQDLSGLLSDIAIPVYGADLEGQSIYDTAFNGEGIVVLGSEGQGLRADIETRITQKVTIPGTGRTESLNVAISAAIFCSEILRNSQKG